MHESVLNDKITTTQHDLTGFDASDLLLLSASRIDLSNFTNTSLQHLSSQAALLLLDTVSCFHQMNIENAAILIQCLRRANINLNTFLHAWLNKHINMPNFDIAFMALAIHIPQQRDIIRALKLSQRQQIIHHLLIAASAIHPGNEKEEKLRNGIIDDYLTDFARGHYAEKQWRLMPGIVNLIPLKKIKTPKQIHLSQTVWKHLRNSDGHILALVLAENTLKHVKMLNTQMSLQELHPLYKAALTHLKNKKESRNILESAIQEIEFEKTLVPKPTSRFTKIKQRLLRGMFYGWQGFFIPNKPRYLPTFSLIASYDGTGTVKRTPHQEKPSLFNLLQQVEGLLPQIDYRALTKLFYALVDFEYEPKFQDNLNLREKVDSLFAHLWEITRIDPTLSIWMHAHMHAFIDNRKQLLAAYCQINQWVAVAGLLSRAEIGPGKNDFDAIASALFTEDQGQFSASEMYNHTQQNKPGILISPRPLLHESAKISAAYFSFYNRNRTKQKSLKLENLQNDHSALEASSNSL